MRMIDLDKEKAEEGCLNWTASDVGYKVEHWVDMASDVQEDYEIIDEHTEDREYLQEIMQMLLRNITIRYAIKLMNVFGII